MKILKFSFIISLFLVATASTAFADFESDPEGAECDCPDSHICESEVVEVCSVEAVPPCDMDDQDCVEPEPSEECFEETITRCVPPECVTDSDCADFADTICVEYVYETCASQELCVDIGSGDDGGSEDVEECGVSEPEDCEVSAERYCVASYLAPCQEDADCGAGFDCAFDFMDECVATPDGSDCADEEEPTDAGPGRCVLERESCEIDSDCDHDFVCHQRHAPIIDCDADTNSGDGEEPGGDGDGDDDSEDDFDTDGCAEPVESDGFCAPENFYESPRGGGSSDPRGSDTMEAEYPGSESGSELIDRHHVGDDEGQSADSEEEGGCSTVNGTPGAPLFVLIAMIAATTVVRRRR